MIYDTEILFFLGAGASHADGAPLQAEIIPKFLSLSNNTKVHNTVAYKELQKFILTFFKPDIKNNIYPSLEQIYGFIQYHLDNDEYLTKDYPTSKLEIIKKYLNVFMHYIINMACTDTNNGIYYEFLKNIYNTKKRTCIITLNYDTLLERAFDTFRNNSVSNSDVKMDIVINYDSDICPSNPCVIKRNSDNLLNNKNKNSASIIKLIKLHGSLNWKYCKCCKRIYLSSWNNEINIDTLNFDNQNNTSSLFRCPYDNTLYNQLIIPPIYHKVLSNHIISQLVSESIVQIRKAKKICFIGYSFPESDLHIKAIFNKLNLKDKEFLCITRSLDKELEYRYSLINSNIKFIQMDFDELVNPYKFNKILNL